MQNVLNLKWDDLRIFLAVARSGSLSAAGKQLAVDPATVGRRISALEAALATRLFTRSAQGYSVTEAGQGLRRHARAMEKAAREIEAESHAGERRLSGKVRIGAPDGVATALLPKALARLAPDYPALEFQLLALPRAVNLTKREADLAIGVSPAETDRLISTPITEYRLHCYASRDFLARQPVQMPEDLAALDLVGYVPDLIFDKALDYLGLLGGESARFAASGAVVQYELVKAGVGPGILHDFLVRPEDGLAQLFTDKISISRHYYMIRHADDVRARALSRFATDLAREIGRAIAGDLTGD
ncbi:LysR family transcriptional regulator [Paracoccaceae bacterium GXU_MW_L88]